MPAWPTHAGLGSPWVDSTGFRDTAPTTGMVSWVRPLGVTRYMTPREVGHARSASVRTVCTAHSNGRLAQAVGMAGALMESNSAVLQDNVKLH